MSIQKKTDRRGRTRYYVSVELPPDPVTGERRRRSVGGFQTKREADAAQAKARSLAERGRMVAPTRQTLAQFLADEWLPAIRTTVRESSWASYASNVRVHITPRIGGLLLRSVGPAHLNALYAELLEGGRKDGKGLSPRTVQLIHVTIHRALRDAVRWGRVETNVADLADPPKQSARPEMRVWDAGETRSFLSHVASDRLSACFLLAATTGMRRGELLGLRWKDLDLEAARLQVRQTYIVVDYAPRFSTPKTKASRRSIALDPATVTGLRDHKKRSLEERLAWGAGYEDSGLVFTLENGAPIHPQRLSDAFEAHGRRAKLPAIRLHDLRHTYATLALSAGVHPKVVSERLGHSSIAITLDTYSHVIPSLGEEAAAQVASLIVG